MGCDIHWHSETRRNGVWKCDQAETFEKEDDSGEEYLTMDNFPGRDRDYWFFGLLNGGVRTEWDWSFPYSEVLPDDVSAEVRKIHEQWDVDAHSTSALTRAELKEKLNELNELRMALLIQPESNHAEVVEHHRKCLEETLSNLTADVADEDQRIVFWFDN
jgi:hypothetical protein